MSIVDRSDPRLGAYTVAPRRERDLNELAGLIAGIALDGQIVDREIIALERWCRAERDWHDHTPFREARDRVLQALAEGFAERVVIGAADAAHRRLHARLATPLAERYRRVLRAPIRMEDDVPRLALADGPCRRRRARTRS